SVQRGFVAGTNNLDFIVNEATGSAGAGGFTGLRVEMVGRFAAPGRVAIPGLKNSGVATPKGTPLPEDAPDPGVILAPGGMAVGPALATTSAGGFPIPPWIANNAYSTWLAPSADTNGPEGDYLYQTT